MLPTLLVSLVFLIQAPVKDSLPGATNVTRVDATIACGGATSAEAFPELKKRGFVSVVSLRREQEAGADIPGAKTAAAASGLKYIHIPIDPAAITDADVDAFLKAVTDP
ncbi:MAG: beta-lactamase hydrolase domain-containing protein, partial [Nitrososphaerales archaeon]